MSGFLYIVDEAGTEIAGSRRAVDFLGDREGYARIHAELVRSAGDDCMVKDSEIDGFRSDDAAT